MLNLICLLRGHDWGGAGWETSYFDSSIPEHYFANYWVCHRCHARATTLETFESSNQRFAAYRQKYGNMWVSTNEFSASKPK